MCIKIFRFLIDSRMQHTEESLHNPEAVPPWVVQSDLDAQRPCKPQSPVHGCF